MSYIEINNLQLNKYNLSSFNIEEGFSYGIIGKNHDDVTKLLKILAGINDNYDTCMNNSKTIFDNSDFFKNRIYIDLSEKIVETLDSKIIKEDLNFRYNVSFNEKQYKMLVNELGIRSEVVITNKYEFSNLGVNLSSYAILCSLSYPNIVVNNPLKYVPIEKKELRNKMINTIIDRAKYQVVIVDASDIQEFYRYLDYLIILGDFEDVHMIKPNSDKFIISDDYLTLKNKIYKKDNIIISKAPTDKDEYKELKKTLKKYKEVSFIEAYSYYMEGIK